MTRQQVNLFQAGLVDKPEPWQSRQAWLILSVFLLLCIVIAVVSARSLSELRSKRDSLKQQVATKKLLIDELEAQYPEQGKNALLEEKLVRLEEKVKRQRTALDYFSNQKVDVNESLIVSLEGLARTTYPGLWLRRVRLAKSGETIELTGSALSADRVPDYLDRLTEDNIFGGRTFSYLQLTRPEDRKQQVDFVLKSAPQKRGN